LIACEDAKQQFFSLLLCIFARTYLQ